MTPEQTGGPAEDRAPRTHRDLSGRFDKGQLIVYTGDGKGKTSAALGTAFRGLGYGYRVAIVQFIKGKWKTGEAKFAETLTGRLDFFAMGDGFTWITQNYEQDVASARRAWGRCLELMADKTYQLVIFDELNYVMKYNFLGVEEVVAGLKQRPSHTHVVVTGRDAPEALMAIADVVTEMRKIKHPYDAGFKAQAGIDF